jgi:predicted ArsR family transcriptional regulator
MAKEVLRRSARDNRYLHKDFHGALSVGLEYLEDLFGEEAVREYLRQFARAYYAPLTADLKRRGLVALKEHFAALYEEEGGEVRVRLSEDELRIEVAKCPAVSHVRARGYPVARLFRETTRTVNETICEGTPYSAELLDYEPGTGRGVQVFRRSEA